MLRVKRNEPLNGVFREGVIIKTRAAFVGTVPNVSEGSEKNVPETAHDWAVVCLVRFEDGEEDELTLAEAEKCAADRDERDLATARISGLAVDENAETEPVGSAFVRAMATKRRAPAEETTSTRRTRQRGRPPLGALSSNQVASRDVKSKVSASAPKGALPSKLAELNETQTTPDSGSGSGSGSGKRRGRKAPDWAVTAVEVMGLTLGCAKCRQSRYGCGLCRERAGICDPENPPVLMLPSVETEQHRLPLPRRRGRDEEPSLATSERVGGETGRVFDSFDSFEDEKKTEKELGGGVCQRGRHLGRHHSRRAQETSASRCKTGVLEVPPGVARVQRLPQSQRGVDRARVQLGRARSQPIAAGRRARAAGVLMGTGTTLYTIRDVIGEKSFRAENVRSVRRA
jgi:hypothetical protein